MKIDRILISCNMEIQHFYFVKCFIEKYKDNFEIKVIFQSHLKKRGKVNNLINLLKKQSVDRLIKNIMLENKYGKLLKAEQTTTYNDFYGNIELDYFVRTIGEENIHITSNVNSNEIVDLVNQYAPDIFLLQGGKLLNNAFINALGDAYILHLHLGNVPFYRGGNSQFWAIYNNAVNENGFTIQSVDLGIDTGAIYIRRSVVNFDHKDGHHSMYCKTQLAGIEAIESLIDFYVNNGKLPSPITVSEKGFNYTGKMVTESANEYVFLNRERVMSRHLESDKQPAFEDISVI
ncbi:hypothetical protein H2O73_10620 [Vibrio sp. 404]|uniref:Formyl transferase N-terminal domain-containing protein n=1 Tax=Vibrio marinisediminis TaxID=2758441 RepID=A0A7W2FR89_9VIBR|nr:formyltransferase family protein [Vibrio marinisediminis]MBA5762798.1 hypothetical protein [Vibrio marinisediminis]